MSCGAFLTAIFSHLLVFSYFWYRPTLFRPPVTVKLEQRVEKCKNTGSTVRSPTLCFEVISYNTDWFDRRFPYQQSYIFFLYRLPQNIVWTYFFSPKCYKNANMTNATSNPLFDFFYGITLIYIYFLIWKAMQEISFPWDFILFYDSVENELGLKWVFILTSCESFFGSRIFSPTV